MEEQSVIASLVKQLSTDPSFFSKFQNFLSTYQRPQVQILHTPSSVETPNLINQHVQPPFTLPSQPIEQIIVSPLEQVQDTLDVIEPFTGVSEERIRDEPSERLRYFHLFGKHVPGLSKSDIKNMFCGKLEYSNGQIFKRKKIRNKKQVAMSPQEFSVEQINSVSQGTFDILEVTKTVQQVGYYIVPPLPLRPKIIEFYHCIKTNHAGVNAIELAIGKKYWWKGMRMDIINYLSTCSICLDLKTKASNIERPITMMIYRPFECFSMDIAFVSKSKGFVGYLLVVEGFTKKNWVQPIKHKDAITVGNILRQLLNELKTIDRIDFEKYKTRFRHDCGLEFVNATVKSILESFGIRDSATNPYSPSENGLAERCNRSMKDGIEVKIRSIVDESDCGTWVDHLKEVVFKYNNTVHSVTKFTPQELFDKVVPSRISDFSEEREKCSIIIDIELVVKTVQERFKKQAERVNKNKANVESIFKENQLVMVAKPPYARAIKIHDGELRKRKAKVLSLTEGNKVIVEWQATGGFLSTETPFTQCKYPIDPKYLSCRVLGCDKDAANFNEEEFEDISQECQNNDVLSIQNSATSETMLEDLRENDDLVPTSAPVCTTSSDDAIDFEEVIPTPVRSRRNKRPSNRISPPSRKK